LFLAAAAAAAVVMDLSDTHRGHHADSLVPTLASLYQWEPFFWMTDRNGLLLPLLAAPVRHPFANLLIQFGLSAFAGVAALGLVARYLDPAATWPAAGAGAWAVLLFACPEYVRFNMLNPCQPYALSLFLAAVGLTAAGRGWRGWAAALGLFAVVGWVNFGVAMNVGPWLLARWLLAGVSAGVTVRGLLGLAFGTAVGLELQTLSDYHDTRLGFAAWYDWPAGWGGVAADLWALYGANLVASAALLAVGLGWRLVPATRAAAGPAVRDGVAALAAFTAAFAYLGTTRWAAQNGYSSRYLFPSVLLLNVAAAGAALGPPLARVSRARPRVLAAVAAASVPAMTLAVYGWPSVGRARAAVDAATGGYTADVRRLRCTHLSGEYWDVWPAVFHTNLSRADHGEPGVVWGVTHRAAPTYPKWSAVPPADVRLGWLIRPGGSEPPGGTAHWWRVHFPALRPAERTPRVWVYVAP
jgi:hypothetical protein